MNYLFPHTPTLEAVFRMPRRSSNRLRSKRGGNKSRRLRQGRRSMQARKSTLVRRRGIRSKRVGGAAQLSSIQHEALKYKVFEFADSYEQQQKQEIRSEKENTQRGIFSGSSVRDSILINHNSGTIDGEVLKFARDIQGGSYQTRYYRIDTCRNFLFLKKTRDDIFPDTGLHLMELDNVRRWTYHSPYHKVTVLTMKVLPDTQSTFKGNLRAIGTTTQYFFRTPNYQTDDHDFNLLFDVLKAYETAVTSA